MDAVLAALHPSMSRPPCERDQRCRLGAPFGRRVACGLEDRIFTDRTLGVGRADEAVRVVIRAAGMPDPRHMERHLVPALGERWERSTSPGGPGPRTSATTDARPDATRRCAAPPGRSTHGPDYREHCLVPLLHDAQLHQLAGGVSRIRRGQRHPSGEAVSSPSGRAEMSRLRRNHTLDRSGGQGMNLRPTDHEFDPARSTTCSVDYERGRGKGFLCVRRVGRIPVVPLAIAGADASSACPSVTANDGLPVAADDNKHPARSERRR